MLRKHGASYREACPVCLGDMVEDEETEGWLVCIICARSFPTAEIEAMRESIQLPVKTTQWPGAA
jgi:hypothetical protein